MSVEKGDDFTSPKQQKRRSGSKTFSYLRQKNEQELAVMKEELEIRKRKMEERQRSNDQMKKLLSKYTITVANINRIFKLYEQVFTISQCCYFLKPQNQLKN